MTPNDKPAITFYHQGREKNLLAVKKSLKQHRNAFMLRRTDFSDDVIDVIADGKIIERHIAKKPKQLVAIVVKKPASIEDMALYQ